MVSYAAYSRRDFELIDTLRAFAALSVIVYHVIELSAWSAFPREGPLVWFRAGWMGVDLFFVISGFVIGLSAFQGLNSSGGSAFRRQFFQRRLRRIVPLHYLTLLAFMILITPSQFALREIGNILSHLLFVHNFFPRYHGAINGSNWSLATEMQFYVLIAFMAPWLRSCRLSVLLGAALVIAWAWRALVFMQIGDAQPPKAMQMFIAVTQLPGMLDEFAFGIVLARLTMLNSFETLMARLRAWQLFVPIVASTFIVFTCSMLLFWPRSLFWDHPGMVIFFRSLLALAFSLIVFAICLASTWSGLVRVLMPLSYLGKISYGLYLWHLPVLLTVLQFKDLSHLQILGLTLCLTGLLAAASWHGFERRFLKSKPRINGSAHGG